MIVALAVAAMPDNSVALWVWLILGGVFFVDATVTLLRRLLRGNGSTKPIAVMPISGSRFAGEATPGLRVSS